MSAAIPELGTAFNVTNGYLGIVSSLFFISYAIGQLINGIIGDRISPYKFLIFALAGTVLINFFISFTNNFYIILICWTINGYFQSMFWGPLMRVLSQTFKKEHNANISVGMSASMVTGYILSWTVLGRVLVGAEWSLYFFIPAVCTFPIIFLWLIVSFSKKSPSSVTERKPIKLKRLWNIIVEEKLYVFVFICVCLGLIKESVSLWAPVIMVKALNFDLNSSFILLFFIPVANFGGILFARLVMKKFGNNVNRTLLLSFAVIAAGSLLLLIFGYISSTACMIMLAVISAMTFGCNSILLSFVPLSYAHKNIVSTLVGVFDFSSYVGAAISAFVLGIILTGYSWRIIPVIWLSMAMIAVIINKYSYVKKSRKVAD